ncbi:MAG: hypothetical protein H0U75_13275 [Legionella sp.]|nr:hypothetical protein [Legionella sp.]
MQLKTVTINLRDLLLATMFSAFSNTTWLNLFKNSPISLINKASLGIVTLILASLQCYYFYHAVNKNFEGWFNTISTIISTGLTSLATYGELLAGLLGFGFAAGIWIFIAGLAVGMVNQLVEAGLNLHRSKQALHGSAQSKHYLQAAIFHGLNASSLGITITALIVSFIIPVAPLVVTFICLSVVGFGLANIAWRFGSEGTKDRIKQGMGLAKPTHEITLRQELKKFPENNPSLQTIALDSEATEKSNLKKQQHLNTLLSEKLDGWQKNYQGVKIESKKKVVALLKSNITTPWNIPSKTEIATKYPKAFQSFWREKGEVEQLYEVVANAHHSKSL